MRLVRWLFFPFTWLWFRLDAGVRDLVGRILQIHDTPESIARGVALGMLVAITPTIGIQMVLVIIVNTVFRANRVAGVAMVWLTNPLTMVPVYWADYEVGRLIYGAPRIPMEEWEGLLDLESTGWLAQFQEFLSNALGLGAHVFMVTFVGGLLLGTALGLPLYPLTFRAVVRHRSRKAAREEERSRRLREGLRLVLASSSPRRRELLAGRDYRFEVRPAGVREEVAPGLSPEEVARELARRKAEAVAPGAPPGSVVVGADTVVALGTEVLGKPADRAEARRMLTRLSGTSHRVITAVCLVEAPGGRPLVRHETTRVVMRPLGAEDVEAYVASGESDGKAGAYAIQETGDRFVRSVEGSYSNVVGLPMELLESMLSELGGGRHP